MGTHNSRRGLVRLAIANVLCAAILMAAHSGVTNVRLQWLAANVQLGTSAIVAGTLYSWALLMALLLKGRFVGLVATIAFALAIGAIQWAGFFSRAPESALSAPSLLLSGLLSLSAFAIAQGMRLLGGVRLVLPSDAPPMLRHRFGIADVVEWTISIAIFFGLGHMTGWNANLAPLANLIGWTTILALPLGLAIVSRSTRRWNWIVAAVCLAFGATVLRNLATWHFAEPTMFVLPKSMLVSYNVTTPAGYLLATGLNFAVVRRLGFRLALPGKNGN